MLRSRPSTLRARLIALVALAVVPVVGGILWAGLQQRHYAIAEVERDALALAASAAAEENRLVVETQQLLSVLAQVPQVRRADPPECGAFLAKVMADGNRYANIGVTSPTGIVQCSALDSSGSLDLSFRSWFVRAVQSGAFSVGDYQVGRITGVASLNFGYPILEEGRLTGVLFVALPLTWLQQRLAVADLPADSDVLVMDGAATVLARYPDERGWTGRSLAGSSVARAVLAGEQGSVAEVTALDGVRRLYATTMLQDLTDEQPVVVSVGIPTAVAYAPVDRAVARNLALLLAALVLIVGLTWWTSDRLVIQPVNALLLATRRLRDGDLTARARTTRAPREIEALGGSFNEMAASLQSYVREIEERLAQIRRLNRIRAVLSGINSAIVRIRDRDELLREACRVSVEEGGFDLAWVAELDREDGKIRVVARSSRGVADPDGEVPPALQAGNGLAAAVLREGAERISNHPGAEPGGREVADLGFRSVAVLPLRVGDRVVAALSLHTTEADFFTEEEVELLQELTADTSLGLAYLEKEKRLDYLANFDPLTDLPNRTLFADRLQQAIGQAREEKRIAGVLVVGVERLAEIHATLGHQAGDQVLRAVAARLRATIGDTDTAARLGNDQFGLVLPGAENVREIERFANDLLLAIPRELVIGDETIFLSARIGVAAFPHDGEDPDNLVKAAALALESADQAGPIAFHSAELDQGADQRRKLEQELRSALARDELAVFYQPVVELATGRPVGMEALVRWTNPELGKVSPGEFIPLAEEMGIVGEIGEWVLGTAAREGRRLHEAGYHELRMNVNVAVSQLREPRFRERFRQIIVDAGIDLAGFGIGIEVTESELMENIGEAFAILEDFQHMGLWIYIDDFGTGYSSLSYLRKLPLDSLKIDRSFIQDIPADPDAVAVVKGIIALSRSLDLRVIAEGIETEEQLAVLRQLGCDAGQGFLFSRPLAAEDLELFLAAHT